MIGFAVKQWICAKQQANQQYCNNVNVTSMNESDLETTPHAPLLGDLPSSNNQSTTDLFMSNGGSNSIHQPSPQSVFMALGKLGLIMAYFFLCDRYCFSHSSHFLFNLLGMDRISNSHYLLFNK